MDPSLNFFVLLMSCFLIPIRSEEENVSIVTEGDALAATQIEVSKRMQADEIEEELLPMMFARGRPASEQFGGGSYTTKEQKALLEAHNNHRKKPSASDMNELQLCLVITMSILPVRLVSISRFLLV
ncbi:hypothetical protein HOLleu_13178 [Holothuria leucospilota]|uniref:Uncharacterized protein n=1 Tax=Holothuria leucospilota TaxID=206669 RepID=A0A9Q1HEH6_HOLLE|nr:hypothetical protein HOLleu_13178 [Holothuria leucospilota]